MKKVVVTNIYGGKNIGDMSIRNEGLRIIEDSLGKQDLILLCESVNNFPIETRIDSKVTIGYAPYGYAIRSEKEALSLFSKFVRFFSIIFSSLFYIVLGLINNKFLPTKGFYSYIRHIKESDLVIAMGGGYFITSHPIKDFFGIVLNVLPLYIARFYGKRIFILPSSFGPFASKIQELIVGNAIKDFPFLAREEISLKKVAKYTHLARFTPDLALYNWEKNSRKSGVDYFTVTFRDGLGISEEKQSTLESDLSKFIKEVYDKKKLKCIFIAMASNVIEENDLRAAKRIEELISNPTIFSIVVPKNPEEAKRILRSAKFSVCNRLHSAILSATVFTPFITIAYAHKTNGFMKSFNLEEWNINMPELTYSKLSSKFNKLIRTPVYKSITQNLEDNRKRIGTYRSTIVQELSRQLI